MQLDQSNTNVSTCSFNKVEQQAISDELNRLLAKEIVEPALHSHGEIISPIFARTKKDGNCRLILNLKQFNKAVEYEHFKMDTIKTITHLIVKDCDMASIDLKDAYYCIAVHPEDRKFLRFTWNKQLYEFTCFPNGLACCPRLFTKLFKAPLATLHRQGHISSSYIDDLYLQGNTYNQCAINVIDTVTQFDALGFISHPDKLSFQPSQQLVILGFLINSHTMTIRLTEDKAKDVKASCLLLLSKTTCKIQEVARVIGKLVASFPGVMFGPLYYRTMELDKTTALKKNTGRYKANMTLSEGAKQELQWWVDNVTTSYNVISRGNYDKMLTTDASLTGWGVVANDLTTGGMWSDREKSYHINALEPSAVYLGLQTFFQNAKDIHILIRSENTTTVSTLNNMGTSHSTLCNQIGKQIWEWCIAKSIWISAAHIPGKLNTLADSESRKRFESSEWMINSCMLNTAIKELKFAPDIDLFASRLNTQFKRYVSYKPDPHAEAIDAFTLNWKLIKFYAFPPFSVIPKLLQKVINDKATGICVLPDWPTQPWFPQAMSLCLKPPIRLKPCEQLLSLPGRQNDRHPLHAKLHLLVGYLSGKD